jgi:arsenite methyltransferase
VEVEDKEVETSHPELSYFELQAHVGTTKHMGGLETTRELIQLCHINEDTNVLDVGCGVGATACYLVKKYGCRVVGVDLHESMIARSNERAQREGVAERVEFRVADAQDLPFDDALFGAVLCESVLTFIKDKQLVISECARVTRPGGYVGLNEELWLETPPAQVVERVRQIWHIKPDIPTLEGWRGLLESAGLLDIVMRTYKFDTRREATQVQRYHFQDMWRMFYRTLLLYIRDPAFRKYMADRRHLPKGLFEYLGYGLFVGRKQGY